MGAAEYLLLTEMPTGGGPTVPTVLQPLSARGPVIDAGGQAWRWIGASAFLLGARIALKQDVRPFLDWAQQTGFNVLRVFTAMDIVPKQRGMDAFILNNDQVQQLLETVNRRGMYVELTVGDMQILMPDHDAQRRYFESIQPGLNPRETCNEPFKNGVDVARMGRIGSGFQASGNYRFDEKVIDGVLVQTMPGVLDYLTYHNDRKDEWPRTPHSNEEIHDGWRAIVSSGPHRGKRVFFEGAHVPVVGDEPTGAAEDPVGNSRSNVPADFFDFAASSALMCAGATFHSSDGISTVVPGPIQQACARQFVAGMAAIPLDAPFGRYTRGLGRDCPLEHKDTPAKDGALRTYVKIQGNRATCIAVRPGPDWTPDWKTWVACNSACGRQRQRRLRGTLRVFTRGADMTNRFQRGFLIAVLMCIAWNAGFLVRAQEPIPIPVPETADAVPPSEVIPDQPALPTTEVPSPGGARPFGRSSDVGAHRQLLSQPSQARVVVPVA